MTQHPFRNATRILIVAVGFLLAVYSVSDAVSRMRAPVAPTVIQAIPADGRLTGKRFDYAYSALGGKVLPSDSCWPCQAREAIARDPLDPAPLRILALYAEREGKRDEARKIMLLSDRVSRRDAMSQAWLLNDAGRRGNVDQLLSYYDRLLSVHNELYPVLFPPLAKALSAPTVRQHLADFIRRDRPWTFNFMIEAGPLVSDPRHLKAMYEATDKGRKPAARSIRAQKMLIGQLAQKGYFAEGLAQARRVATDDRAELDSFSFPDRDPAEGLLPFTWTRGDNGAIGTKFEGRDGVIIENGAGGESLALYRVLVLAPGRYSFTGSARAVEGYAALSGRWDVFCVIGAAQQQLASLQVADAPKTRSIEFVVSQRCAATRIDFTVASNSSTNVALLRLLPPDLHQVR